MKRLICYNKHKLNSFSIKNCKIHNKLHFHINVRLHSVYDGDTIKVIYYNKQVEEPVIVSCRLKGIDTPEIRPPKNIDNRNDILVKAQIAKEATSKYFQHKDEIFGIQVEGLDKYGRWLITEQPLNDELIRDGLAVEYDGGTK
jgi:endonuclease YncB( thermonuclease family)